MRTLTVQAAAAALLVAALLACAAMSSQARGEDAALRITTSGNFPDIEVTLENSVFKAVLRTAKGGKHGQESAIRSWVIKATGQDVAGAYIDACAFRAPMNSATLTYDGADKKTVRMTYGDGKGGGIKGMHDYTIYPHSPAIRIDYVQYDFGSWHNTVDMGSPGKGKRTYKFHGGDKWIRGYVLYPKSYWNTYDKQYANDPKDGGALSYKGHIIGAVAGEDGVGFARIMPVKGQGPTSGGVRIVKLLSNRGFETFPSTGDSRSPFTGHIFLFTRGLDDAISMGRRIVDGDMLTEGPTATRPTSVSSPALARPALTADWPQWRGPQRSGVTSERSGYPTGWPPKRLWEKNVGKGCTSPILAQGRLYVMGYEGSDRGRGTDSVWCLEARTGKELWRRTYPAPSHSRLAAKADKDKYTGPSSTPAFDSESGYLYTASIDGDLVCWNTGAKGEPVWRLNLYGEYNVPQRPDVGRGLRDYGFTSSPLLYGDTVVVEVGENAGTIMAFDKRTGERRWRSQYAGPAGHSSGPVWIDVDGVPCLATFALKELVVMRLDAGHEGKTVAEYPWQTDYGCNIATPAVQDQSIVLTTGDNMSRTARLKVEAGAVRQEWATKSNVVVTSPVIHNGRLYIISNGRLRCLDFADGKTLWEGGRFQYGSCLATGDDKILVFDKGSLVLVEAGGTEYRELARVDGIVPATCYPHVALADGLIACKDFDGNLVVFAVGEAAR